MFPETKSWETSGLEGKQNQLFPSGSYIKCFVMYLNFPLKNHMAKTNKRTIVFGARATTAQFYPGRDPFEFDQWYVTKNQPITVLVLLSESRGI